MHATRGLLNTIILIYMFLKNNLCFFKNGKSKGSIYPSYNPRSCRGRDKVNHVKNVCSYTYSYGFVKNFFSCNLKGNRNLLEDEIVGRNFFLKGRKNSLGKKYKRNGNKIFAESLFFNPKQFKNLFPEEVKKKGDIGTIADDCLELEQVENLKEISPDLYKKLNDFNNAEKIEKLKDGTNETEENADVVDPKDISVYEGLPLLMIDGKDFQGFDDNRKIRISPKISTPFDNSEYEDFVKSNGKKNVLHYAESGASYGEGEKKSEGCADGEVLNGASNGAVNETYGSMPQVQTDSSLQGIEENNDLNDFERDVMSIIKQKDKKRSDNSRGREGREEKLSKEERIERYKKVGKHYYIDSHLGEILHDRDYPGYIYLNHGENLKELDEKSEFDSESPRYINPSNIYLRTGRKREKQKKQDSGIKQKKRWNSKVEKDIKRGNWKYYDDTVKDLLDSTDQEKLEENYYSNNYYQRTNNNTGFGSLEKVQNNYFDVQFIGSAETYPANISVGMNFIWPINFIPLLCKQYTKRLGQPIKSDIFNLGGFDSIQLWFYPDGMNNSIDGYCSLKLVMRPGSYLPVKIFFFAFSEYNYIHTNPFYKESADYVTSSLNLCKCLLKTKENLRNIENNKDYVILGPAGNIYIGVGIFDDNYDFEQDFKKFYTINKKYKNKKVNQKHEYKYDWDEGVHIFDNWLKKQTAITDDKDELLPVYYTHSEMYENYKYRYVPEKNPFKFLNKKTDKTLWNRHPF
ncbi:hypothetical protein, conserved [Plasmodium gonderi]|uniref:Uncharacterized protein n=1 Tax=Plasmodium gonderi TaxID=77519 RepID=A0A1Y1JQ38_PLAGO|nr:hypothetical protein, conserved [Plasmodium gonderi]GAW83595.1 hypothetical protein, conserved [Plasmodium gonderi]